MARLAMLAGDAQGGDDLAQVAGHRLAQRQGLDRALRDLLLQLVDVPVVLDDLGRQRRVAPRQRLDGPVQRRLGQAPHAHDGVLEFLELRVEGPDDVLAA
jgi:hypothetical protein